MNQDIKKTEHDCLTCKVVFVCCLVVAIGLIVGGFVVPPTGVIDGSVLTAVGELFAFAALSVGANAIRLGYDLKFIKGDTTINLNNNDDKD